MGYLIDIDGLTELELAGKWEDARRLLLNTWEADSDNVGKLCRVLSECWYVMSEWDCSIDTDGLDLGDFKRTLIRVTNYGLARFSLDWRFLWMAGYMISLFPYFFHEGNSDDLFLEWEEKGREMISRSADICPDDMVIKTVYLGLGEASEEYTGTKEQARLILSDAFPGDTAIEEYFRDVQSR